MRYLLDTNIISNVIKAEPSKSLLDWMAEQRDEDLFIASLTVAEIQRGILEKPAGKKRNALEAWFSGPDGPPALFAGRVLPFDLGCTQAYADLMAKARASGLTIAGADGYIAAIAAANGLAVATRDTGPFEAAGLAVINPWQA